MSQRVRHDWATEQQWIYDCSKINFLKVRMYVTRYTWPDASVSLLLFCPGPILWPPDTKNWLIGKDPDAGKDWREEKKGMTEDEMASVTRWTCIWTSSRSWWWEAWCASVHDLILAEVDGKSLFIDDIYFTQSLTLSCLETTHLFSVSMNVLSFFLCSFVMFLESP